MEATLPIARQTPTLPVRLDQLSLDAHRSIYVVRDDLLPAGTKQRAILPLLRDLEGKGIRHLTYSSPFAGFAQVALAYGCQALSLQCTLFCEKDPGQAGKKTHAFTELAARHGAKIVLVDSLAEGEERAEALARSGHAHKIPLGFHCREFQEHFQAAITESLETIRRELGHTPERAWLPIGSGTLAHAFRQATPTQVQLHCVDVHVLHASDLRIQRLRAFPNLYYYSAQENFPERAERPPPIPSNLHYDAKIWAFVSELARDGDLWWNVAR